MRPLYIFDLDGTLALIEHRRHFVECDRKDRNWPAFHAACVDDMPNAPVIKTFRKLAATADVWVWSGRSDAVRMETEEWLRDFAGRNGEWFETSLTMRCLTDHTPDDVLKKQWLDNMLVDDRQRLVAVFDDRDRVVKMWRDNGVACFQVAPGNF